MGIHASISEATLSIEGSLSLASNRIPAIVDPSDDTYYEYTYEVTASLGETQVLPTKNKYLTDDITIQPVPSTTTINPQGGYTLYIG